jgi:hypothetical protein
MLCPQSDGEQPILLLQGHSYQDLVMIRRAANRRSAQQSRSKKKVLFSSVIDSYRLYLYSFPF